MSKNKGPHLLFSKENYLLLIAGVGLLLTGFILMSGGGAESLTEFNEEEIFSTRRITVAPLVIMLGFGIVFYAILRKPRTGEKDQS